jgi:XTP/dITP diphosphohydrolase
VPAGLPALVKATRIQEKVKQVGFEWEVKEQVYEKIKEEMEELQEAIKEGEQSAIESELGDVLFSVVNYARFLSVDADSALERTNQKFMQRFRQMEALVQEEGGQLKDMTLAELDALWNKVKNRN